MVLAPFSTLSCHMMQMIILHDENYTTLEKKKGPNNYKILCLENAFKRLKRSSYKVDFNVTKQKKTKHLK